MRKQTAKPELQEKLETWIKALDQPPSNSGTAVEYRCTLVTPMYGGGVKAGQVDRAMPIRATAIRGQLRRWWRFLNRFDSDGTTLPAKMLFERERAIWGGLGDANASSKHGALTKSKVMVAVAAPVVASQRVKSPQDYPRAKYVFVSTDTRPQLLAQDMEFVLTLSFPEALRAQIEECVRWWANFGGVGARTRRGAGAVLVEKVGKAGCGEEKSFSPIEPILSDTARKYGCKLHLQSSGNADAMVSWDRAIKKLRNYRQGRKDQRDAGTWMWPEGDVIRTLHGSPVHPGRKVECAHIFPRALFGLPIITHFKNSEKWSTLTKQMIDPPNSTLQPVPAGYGKPAERMASPLILRPMYIDTMWYPAALLLPTDAAQSMGLQLSFSDESKHRFASGTWWDISHRSSVTEMIHMPMLSYAGAKPGCVDISPLALFMDRFGSERFPPARASKHGHKPPPPPCPKPAKDSTPKEITLKCPTLEFNSRNHSISVIPADGSKMVVLCGADALHCMSALSQSAQARLRDPQKRKYNRLSITLLGTKFISLQEDAK